LVLDIGNTRVKAGIFDGERLVGQANWEGNALEELPVWLGGRTVKAALVSSVAAEDPALLDWMRTRMEVLELNAQTPLPFRNMYTTPETLGKDRVAAVAGAQARFPGRNCLIVDCGTCIKYELLTADGVYLGGNIAPGLHMRIQAMHYFTARLPEVEMTMPASPVGDSTMTALQNGALRGAVLEIAGFSALFRERWPDALLILSGGDAGFLMPYLPQQETVTEEHLILYGLNAIVMYNLEQPLRK
jgi:type III pantothenate kinase